jgi:hypothetical protein
MINNSRKGMILVEIKKINLTSGKIIINKILIIQTPTSSTSTLKRIVNNKKTLNIPPSSLDNITLVRRKVKKNTKRKNNKNRRNLIYCKV